MIEKLKKKGGSETLIGNTMESLIKEGKISREVNYLLQNSMNVYVSWG